MHLKLINSNSTNTTYMIVAIANNQNKYLNLEYKLAEKHNMLVCFFRRILYD